MNCLDGSSRGHDVSYAQCDGDRARYSEAGLYCQAFVLGLSYDKVELDFKKSRGPDPSGQRVAYTGSKNSLSMNSRITSMVEEKAVDSLGGLRRSACSHFVIPG
jgi:hypothetical protein